MFERGDVFGWFKRLLKKSRRPTRPRRKLPPRQLAPVEEIVEQGLLVADVAVRMNVKNAIILNALGRKADYDEQQIKQMVRDAAQDIATERERDATHIERMRTEIREAGYSSWSESDYGSEDNATLNHRQQVYEQIAVHMRQRSQDDDYLRDAAERARLAAWHEIGDSLKEKASHPYYAGGSSEEYQRERDSRIELLIQRDLTELMQTHRTQKSEKRSGIRRVFSRRDDA